MMGIEALRDLKGRGVNVVIIDQGLNQDEIEARHPEGGWRPCLHDRRKSLRQSHRDDDRTGSAPRTSHGMMIARNILDIAPEATLYDVPLIPTHIARANIFASTAHATFKAVIDKISQLKEHRGANGAWILVNAWAIFDRSANTRKATTRVIRAISPPRWRWQVQMGTGSPAQRPYADRE